MTLASLYRLRFVPLAATFAFATNHSAPAAGTVIASNMNAASVSLVDVASGATIATIPTSEGPHEVGISHSGRYAVVSIYGRGQNVGSSLMVIDLGAAMSTRIIELGAGNQRPHGIAFLPNDKQMLITGERAQRVLLVDFETGKIDSSISTGQTATHMVSLTRDGKHAYTTNISAMTVSSIDVEKKTVAGTFPVGARIEGIAVTPDGREVWVGGNETKKVYVLNGQTGAVEHTIEGFGMAYRVGITPDGKTAIISDPGAEKIHVYDVATHTSRAVIDVPGMESADGQPGRPSSPQGVTVARDNRTAFVTLKAAAKVAIVDIPSAKIVGTLPVGAGSDGVGYSPLVIRK